MLFYTKCHVFFTLIYKQCHQGVQIPSIFLSFQDRFPVGLAVGLVFIRSQSTATCIKRTTKRSFLKKRQVKIPSASTPHGCGYIYLLLFCLYRRPATAVFLKLPGAEPSRSPHPHFWPRIHSRAAAGNLLQHLRRTR